MLPSSLLALARTHWRWAAGAAALVLAFAGGRFAAPTKTVTQTVDRVVYRDRVVTQTVREHVTAAAEVRVVYRDRTVVTRADGTVERRDVTQTETGRATSHVAVTETARTVEHATEHEHATSKTVERTAPQWHVSALAVVDPLHLTAPAWGAAVERRVLGPVWLGAVALQPGGVQGLGLVVGLTLSVEF